MIRLVTAVVALLLLSPPVSADERCAGMQLQDVAATAGIEFVHVPHTEGTPEDRS